MISFILGVACWIFGFLQTNCILSPMIRCFRRCLCNFCLCLVEHPIKVKLNVLDSCVLSSLWYGCETWGESSLDELDVIHRIGLKTSLSVRNSTCKEITYIEADAYPTFCTVKRRQLKFWISLCNNLHTNSSLYNLIEKAKEKHRKLMGVM